MMDTDSYYQAKAKNGTVTKYRMVEVKKDTPKIDNKFEAGDIVTATKDAPKFYASGEKLTVEGVLADIDINIVKNAQGTVFAYYSKEIEPYTGE